MDIIGPDGKKLSAQDFVKEYKVYKVGNVEFKTEDNPTDILKKATVMSQQTIQQQIYFAEMQNGATQEDAKVKAMTAATYHQNPWQMEPCAWAVFMMLAEQVHEKNQVIDQLAARLKKLDGQELEDVKDIPVEVKK